VITALKGCKPYHRGFLLSKMRESVSKTRWIYRRNLHRAAINVLPEVAKVLRDDAMSAGRSLEYVARALTFPARQSERIARSRQSNTAMTLADKSRAGVAKYKARVKTRARGNGTVIPAKELTEAISDGVELTLVGIVGSPS